MVSCNVILLTSKKPKVRETVVGEAFNADCGTSRCGVAERSCLQWPHPRDRPCCPLSCPRQLWVLSKPRAFSTEGTACLLLAGFSLIPSATLPPAWWLEHHPTLCIMFKKKKKRGVVGYKTAAFGKHSFKNSWQPLFCLGGFWKKKPEQSKLS